MKTAAAIAILTLATIHPAYAEGRTHIIEIGKMAFANAPDGIRVGDTIVWHNKDVVSHTATAFSGVFDVVIPAGAEAKTVVNTAGVYPYFCRFHLAMKSALSIQP